MHLLLPVGRLFREGTLAGTFGKGKDAPIAAVRASDIKPPDSAVGTPSPILPAAFSADTTVFFTPFRPSQRKFDEWSGPPPHARADRNWPGLFGSRDGPGQKGYRTRLQHAGRAGRAPAASPSAFMHTARLFTLVMVSGCFLPSTRSLPSSARR